MDSDIHKTESLWHLACKENEMEIIDLLLEKGADVNELNSCGSTPLVESCEGRRWDIIKKLVEYDPIFKAIDPEELSQILLACEERNLEAIERIQKIQDSVMLSRLEEEQKRISNAIEELKEEKNEEKSTPIEEAKEEKNQEKQEEFDLLEDDLEDLTEDITIVHSTQTQTVTKSNSSSSNENEETILEESKKEFILLT